MPDFHGYGYNSWQTPGSWGGSASRSRMGIFHGGGSGSVGIFGGPMGRGPTAHSPNTQKAASHGTVSPVDPLGGMVWGKGTEAVGNVLKAGTRRSQPRARQGGFQDVAGERYIGDVGHKPVGALAPGNQAALGRAYPGAIETTATMGALAPGARVMPSGPRPAGPAPTPFALPARTGSAAPLGPGRRRGRAQSFGQLQFGGT